MTQSDQTNIQRAPRAVCPLCGKDVALRRRGEIREHRAADGSMRGVCAGSGYSVARVAAAVAAADAEAAQ